MKVIRSVLVLAVISTAARAQETDMIIDHSRADFGGQRAVGMWVTESSKGPLATDSTSYSIHLIPFSDVERELVYPCCEWFAPPPGRYRLFAQSGRKGREKISPFLTLMTYHGGRFEGRGLAGVLPVVSAGRVVVPDSFSLDPEMSVRLLHLDSHLFEGILKRELARVATGDDMREGVIMPKGPVFVAFFDKARNEYVSLARPVNVPEGGTVDVVPSPPAGNATDLLAILMRGKTIGSQHEDDVEVLWEDGESDVQVSPEVLVRTADRLYAIWYGLRGDGRLEVRSSTQELLADAVHLTPGKIERVLLTIESVRE